MERQLEIENLVRHGTLEIVMEENVPQDTNIIEASFVVAIKIVELTTNTRR